MRTAITATLLPVMALSACGGGSEGPAGTEPSPKTTVVLADHAYVPASVRVESGSRVTFFNRSERPNTAERDGADFFGLDRDAQDAENRFDTHVLQPGEAESVEFDTPGTYVFRSSLDSRMQGTIEVVEPSE